ncbi:7-deoxyloganetic acid glucosyltransferase-like [Malania oleifera]|uniref:7-deoxyloganetic acid glucosyltransferase-like n=1 Tax=Malania oleifera TaxID=397392 RepID=UPI0025AEC72D|nr:7-deoxyloganetic acid glucosyltransferase-like [Malania oleifera]
MDHPPTPHVLITPFPLQGHVKPMLSLALLLSGAGVRVTFLNSDHNHALLDVDALRRHFPGLRFASIPDGLPPEHPRTAALVSSDLFFTTDTTKPIFREYFISLCGESGQWLPPTCIIADGVSMSLVADVAEEFEIPIIAFPTYNACSAWVLFHIPKLIQEGEIPFQGDDDDLDRPVTSIPGLETLLRRRDLPNICRFKDIQDPILQFFISQAAAVATRSSALILNTFDDAEHSVISRLRSFFTKIYTVGPLRTLSKSLIGSPECLPDGSLQKQDRRCIEWLNSQAPKSVIYISFGSIVVLNRTQLLEIWHGLVNSGKPYLWALRRDAVIGEEAADQEQIPSELEEGVRGRGCVVGWAPQEEVLAHWALGGFLTHSGWNSTLESMVAGVPMICWPQLVDQQVSSRWVSDVWRIGLDMKDRCDRSTVEKMVRDLLEGKREEIMDSTDEIARKARACCEEGGSSFRGFQKLIEDIRVMHLAGKS